MNGRPLPDLRSDDYLSSRLFAALMASCLIHAAVIVMPYFGASTTASRPAILQSGKARALQVKFVVVESAPAAVAAEKSAAEASAPDSQDRRAADEERRAAADRAMGAGLLPIRGPAYYTTDQLTKRPEPTSQPSLLTSALGPAIPSGKVILKLWITEFGTVASVDVEKSDMPEAISATAAEAFAKLRFVPGQLNGRTVGSVMRIEVIYYDGAGPPP